MLDDGAEPRYLGFDRVSELLRRTRDYLRPYGGKPLLGLGSVKLSYDFLDMTLYNSPRRFSGRKHP